MMDGFDAIGFHAPHKKNGREAPALKPEADPAGPTKQIDIGQLQGCGLQEQLWNTYNNGVSVVNGTLDATPPRRDPLDRRSGSMSANRFMSTRRRFAGGHGSACQQRIEGRRHAGLRSKRAGPIPAVAKRRNIASIRFGCSFAPPSSHQISTAM
jgi:hypothetical protein